MVADDSTTGAVTTDDATTTSSSGNDSGTDTGEQLCAAPERVSLAFTVSPDESTSATCSVLAVGGAPEQAVIMLDCDGQEVTLTLAITPQLTTPSVTNGQLVRLEYIRDPIFWVNRWLALHSAGGESDWLLVGAVESSTLDPPGTTLDAFFGASFGGPSVTAVSGLCEPIEDICGPLERIALELGLADVGGSLQVLDQTVGFIDVLAFGYAVVVQRAVQYPRPQTCDDIPPAWFHFAMVWFGSD
jgi:hypothetical protein